MPRRILLIPQFNEERTIVQVLENAQPYVDTIVVVDDGSTDSSLTMIYQWMRQNNKGVLINLRVNQGVSGALLIGFHWIYQKMQLGEIKDDDLVITIDADGQHCPEEIPAMCQHLNDHDCDLVLGRRDFCGYPLYKRFGNWGLTIWGSLLGGQRFYDVENGFRVMRALVVPGILGYFTGRRYGCSQELAIIPARLGFRINNKFPTAISYYRPGARMRDGITNMTMGLIAFLRVVFNIKNNIEESACHWLGPIPNGQGKGSVYWERNKEYMDEKRWFTG